MQNNEIKEWEIKFRQKFVKEPTDWRESGWTVPFVDSRADKLEDFISNLLSEHRNKVLEEVKGVVEEEKRKYTKCVHILCECSGRIESLKNTLESIDKLKNK
jgi:hypothetical protein